MFLVCISYAILLQLLQAKTSEISKQGSFIVQMSPFAELSSTLTAPATSQLAGALSSSERATPGWRPRHRILRSRTDSAAPRQMNPTGHREQTHLPLVVRLKRHEYFLSVGLAKGNNQLP